MLSKTLKESVGRTLEPLGKCIGKLGIRPNHITIAGLVVTFCAAWFLFHPTGAGDSFAGATMGYLANVETVIKDSIIVAMNYGAAVASITVEGLGTNRIMDLSKPEVEERFQKLSGGPGRI